VPKVSTNLKQEFVAVPLSFESNELGTYKIKMPYPGTVVLIDAFVTKGIAAGNAGAVLCLDNNGNTMANITLTAGAAIGTGFTATPTVNNTFVAGDILVFTTSKATAGGKATLSIKVTRS
jgi:hypothetical protein